MVSNSEGLSQTLFPLLSETGDLFLNFFPPLK